jgi:hypothetical protein
MPSTVAGSYESVNVVESILSDSRNADASAAAQDLRGAGDGAQLLLGNAGRGHRTVGEGCKAAVGREQHALRTEEPDGVAATSRDLFDRLDPVVLLVHHADPDAPVGWQVLQDVHLTRARRGQFQEERADADLLEER